MQKKQQVLRSGSGILFAILLVACASTAYIPVRYQLAPKSSALQNQTVYLKVSDARTDTRIFDASAEKEFANFNGNFALVLAYGDEKGLVDGTYDDAGHYNVLKRMVKQAGEDAMVVPIFITSMPTAMQSYVHSDYPKIHIVVWDTWRDWME